MLYPTGGGKSLTYQIPGICLPGLTLVISPLIALMKVCVHQIALCPNAEPCRVQDQVDTLRARDVSAASLDSSLSMEESRAVKDSVLDGSLKILYVAPERYVHQTWLDDACH